MRDTLDQGGLAKPKDEPPVGIDLARYRAGDKPRDPLVKPEAIKAGAANLWDRIRDGAEAFADWTIDVGERADIPARVEAMEIPRRSRELAAKTGELTARAARAVGRGSAKASRAAARASAAAWDKMAIGDKVSRLSREAGRGLGEVADKAKAGIGNAARAGGETIRDGIGGAATKLRPAPREELAPPPSGLVVQFTACQRPVVTSSWTQAAPWAAASADPSANAVNVPVALPLHRYDTPPSCGCGCNCDALPLTRWRPIQRRRYGSTRAP